MLNTNSEKKKTISELKRRVIEILVSIPFGIGFAVLFWYLNMSAGLQLFLTVLCWGVVIVAIDLIAIAIIKSLEKRREKNPRTDPFADTVFINDINVNQNKKDAGELKNKKASNKRKNKQRK